LKLLLQLEAMRVDELGQRETPDLGLAGKPARSDELLDLFR